MTPEPSSYPCTVIYLVLGIMAASLVVMVAGQATFQGTLLLALSPIGMVFLFSWALWLWDPLHLRGRGRCGRRGGGKEERIQDNEQQGGVE